jgi:hypothetical protein
LKTEIQLAHQSLDGRTKANFAFHLRAPELDLARNSTEEAHRAEQLKAEKATMMCRALASEMPQFNVSQRAELMRN